MLEDSIGDATTAEGRARLVARFEAALAELAKARAAEMAPEGSAAPTVTPETLARLEVFRDPTVAWARFTRRSRKEIVRALAKTITIYPDLDGYFVVADWEGGGRAAAKVKTHRRRKIFPVPSEVLALFDGQMSGESVHRRVAGRLGRGPRDGPG